MNETVFFSRESVEILFHVRKWCFFFFLWNVGPISLLRECSFLLERVNVFSSKGDFDFFFS